MASPSCDEYHSRASCQEIGLPRHTRTQNSRKEIAGLSRKIETATSKMDAMRWAIVACSLQNRLQEPKKLHECIDCMKQRCTDFYDTSLWKLITTIEPETCCLRKICCIWHFPGTTVMLHSLQPVFGGVSPEFRLHYLRISWFSCSPWHKLPVTKTDSCALFIELLKKINKLKKNQLLHYWIISISMHFIELLNYWTLCEIIELLNYWIIELFLLGNSSCKIPMLLA